MKTFITICLFPVVLAGFVAEFLLSAFEAGRFLAKHFK